MLRPMGPSMLRWRIGSVLLLLAAGCQLRVPSPTYISETKLIAVKAEVTELGPLNPDRVGVPSVSPIAEAMPGDRLALEAVVVDPDGAVLEPDEVESIWFQLGMLEGLTFEAPELDVPCDELDPHTLDDVCRIGSGNGRFESVVPNLGALSVDTRIVSFYGVIAWNGRSAEDCWAERRSREAVLDDCGFMQRQVKVGPSWWLLAYAESLGLTSMIPVHQIPIAVYAQQANRVPNPRIEVWVEGELLGSYPDTAEFTARLGDSIHLEIIYDPLEQLMQAYFYALFDEESQSYWFQAAQEFMSDTIYTTGSIHVVGDDQFGMRRDFVVDEYAEPGSAQMFIRYNDDRYGEGVARLDFEVER